MHKYHATIDRLVYQASMYKYQNFSRHDSETQSLVHVVCEADCRPF